MTNDGWRPGPLSPADNDEPAFWTRFGRVEEEESAPRERPEHSTGWFRRRPAAPPVGDPAAAPGFGTSVPAFRSDHSSDAAPAPPAEPEPEPEAEQTHLRPRPAPPIPMLSSPPALEEDGDESATTRAFAADDAVRTAGFDALPADDDAATGTFRALKPDRGTGRLLSATAIMAAGTIMSRILGFVRVVMAAWLLGAATRQADIFSMATTVPNSLYILFAGGALNTVLVPQIVRAVKNDKDVRRRRCRAYGQLRRAASR